MDYSYPVTLDYSYHRWTIRTLDCSYRGLFIPSWTVRTMDYSYHQWTIRTVLQDSQKLTFPTKMCLCSVSQTPLNFSDIFPKRLGLFSPNFIFRLRIPIYAGLQVFIQLSATLTKLCHIKRDHHHI